MKALEIKNFTKKFGSLVANDDISFSLDKGEVLAILGENGAGKTTLMRSIYGMDMPDKGQIWINGRQEHITCPKEAIRLGIGMVHQHFMLINNFTVAENLVLGMREYTGQMLNRKDLNLKINSFFQQYHFDVPADIRVRDLPVGLQQRVEIMKALFRKAEILVLDEPTAVLTPQETKDLFVIIHKLQEEGKSIIFISHKLDEVKEISQRIMVLRMGKVSGIVDTKDADEGLMARMMIGRDLVALHKTEVDNKLQQDKVLQVEKLVVKDGKKVSVKGIDFSVFSNEILGVAGIDGNGQLEMIEAITGLRKAESGHIILKGKNIKGKSVRYIRNSGLAHIPEDRRARGLILNFSLVENCILVEHDKKHFCKGIILNRKAAVAFTKENIKNYRIKTEGENAKAASLSGGNQQKVIVAREIATKPELLIAMKPTRGLDVGAVEYIHSCLLAERDKGKGVLLLSSELEEIMSLSDRIMVMHGGIITGIVYPEEVTAEEIGLMMAGSKREKMALSPRKGVV
ncbi:MAG: yufO [Clostridiales bacterium]|nr:yufO [Clostridiales bacterium]